MFIRAWSLVSHLHHLKLSPNAHFPPPPCLFECSRPSPTSNMSIRTQSFVIHLHHIDLSLNACFPPPLCRLELSRLSPASVISIQAQSLFYPPLCHPSANARVPPKPSPFERDPSSPTHTAAFHLCPTFTVSSRARSVVSHPYHVNSSATARLPPPPCPLRPDCSPPTPTVSIRA